MTVATIRAKLAVVNVFVAISALSESQGFEPDITGVASTRRIADRYVALLTENGGVFAIENISGFPVIESDGGFP